MRKLALAACALAAVTLGVHASDSPEKAGAELGRSLVEGAAAPRVVGTGGKGGMGTLTAGEYTIDIADLAPGATRAEVDRLAASPRDIDALQAKGQEAFSATARAEGSAGEAARALVSSKAALDSETVDLMTQQVDAIERNFASSDLLGQAFSDCKSTVTSEEQDVLTTTEEQVFTCAAGSQGAACGRTRRVAVEWLEEPSGPREGPAPMVDADHEGRTPVLREEIIYDGTCESEATGNACSAVWTCTDAEPRWINGILVDEAVAAEHGLEPLYPGAPAMCWAARASLSCPVCVDQEDGSQRNCVQVSLDNAEGDSCAALSARTGCQRKGEACLLTDRNGNCVTKGFQYTCSKPVSVTGTKVSRTNSCAGIARCADGSCSAFEDEPEGMSVQVAMAQLAVANASTSDITRNQETVDAARPVGGAGGVPATVSDPDDLAAQWGYDAPAEAGIEAPTAATPEQAAAMAEVQLFKGSPYSCQKGYGGLVDCCKATDGGAKKLFWEIQAEVSRSEQASRGMAQGGKSGYAEMAAGSATLATLSNPFTSLRDNVIGGGSGSIESSSLTVWEQFMYRARTEIKPALSPKWACTDKEFDLAVQREIGTCSYAGSYCSKSVLGVCLKRREAYCCYKSPMSKMLRASAEPGGVIDHGSPKRPDCSGLPLDRMGDINWDVMDFEQLAGNMDQGGVFDKVNAPSNAAQNFTGTGTAAASEGRQTVDRRTADRLNDIDTGKVYSGIAEDVASRATTTSVRVGASTPVLSFAHPIRYLRSAAAVIVTRVGSSGPASARVYVAQGNPLDLGLDTVALSWGAGEVGDKNISIRPKPGASGRYVLMLDPEVGQAGAHASMVVVLDP